jgi:hypothetical protein
MTILTKSFLKAVTGLAESEPKFKECYCLNHSGNGSFYNVDLSNLVFVANNPYHLWVLVYNYMNKNSSCCKKIVIRSNDEQDNLVSYIYEGETSENDKHFDMADNEYLLSFTSESLDYDNDDDIFYIVENVITDFFQNDDFWARKIRNDFLTDDDEEENQKFIDAEEEDDDEDEEEDDDEDEDDDDDEDEDDDDDDEEKEDDVEV